MESSKNKKSRLSEIVIVIMLTVCVALILADLGTNLVNELNSRSQDALVLEATPISTSTPAARPTYPPDFTPEVITDA
jgi:hypothetical protein